MLVVTDWYFLFTHFDKTLHREDNYFDCFVSFHQEFESASIKLMFLLEFILGSWNHSHKQVDDFLNLKWCIFEIKIFLVDFINHEKVEFFLIFIVLWCLKEKLHILLNTFLNILNKGNCIRRLGIWRSGSGNHGICWLPSCGEGRIRCWLLTPRRRLFQHKFSK